MQTTITDRGQISIPADIRKRFHLKAGMGILWLERDEGIFLMPVPEDPIKAFQTGPKIAVADLLAARKKDRQKKRSGIE